jgi:hypothetical protein
MLLTMPRKARNLTPEVVTILFTHYSQSAQRPTQRGPRLKLTPKLPMTRSMEKILKALAPV